MGEKRSFEEFNNDLIQKLKKRRHQF